MDTAWPIVLASRLEASFRRFRSFAATLDSSTVNARLPGLRSNSIGAQLWCVIGARESYAAALRAGAWAGFSCSVETAEDLERLTAGLHDSEATVRRACDAVDPWTEAHVELGFALLEHEAAHQGQLIRYLYGLDLTIPPDWRERYALSD